MSAELRCIGTPISWLRLEQHHAGELTRAERKEIQAHLAACAACAACSAQIESDTLVPLAALPTTPPVKPPARVLAFHRVVPVVAALAVAACILLFLRRGSDTNPRELDPLAARTKGGDISFVLVRDDEAVVAEAGGVYRDGDRWKALVTCPAGMQATWDLVVVENGETAYPLAPGAQLECGNAVPLAGAFRTTGHARMTVCLVWDQGATCKVLDPAP